MSLFIFKIKVKFYGIILIVISLFIISCENRVELNDYNILAKIDTTNYLEPSSRLSFEYQNSFIDTVVRSEIINLENEVVCIQLDLVSKSNEKITFNCRPNGKEYYEIVQTKFQNSSEKINPKLSSVLIGKIKGIYSKQTFKTNGKGMNLEKPVTTQTYNFFDNKTNWSFEIIFQSTNDLLNEYDQKFQKLINSINLK